MKSVVSKTLSACVLSSLRTSLSLFMPSSGLSSAARGCLLLVSLNLLASASSEASRYMTSMEYPALLSSANTGVTSFKNSLSLTSMTEATLDISPERARSSMNLGRSATGMLSTQ